MISSIDGWRSSKKGLFAGWTPSDQLYQLKLHLDRTGLKVFRLLPENDNSCVERVVTALRKRFRPADIKELHGLEFYHLTQTTKTIEQIGIKVQKLGRKAFPSIVGKDFDRLLKSRFYQALLVKLQRKLESPKPDETFHDLFARACMLERYEKQYTASAEARTGSQNKRPLGEKSQAKKPPSDHPAKDKDNCL